MKKTNIKRTIQYRRKIQLLTQLFNKRKTELSAGYQGYHELKGFVDECEHWGIMDRGQEKALDEWIDFLNRWPFARGTTKSALTPYQRNKAMWKQQFICTMCGRSADEVHHIIPRSKGGRNTSDNLTILCRECHEKIHKKKKK